MGDTTLLVERSGLVATVSINRPAAVNAVNAAALRELLAVAAELATDEQKRAVILTGTGCAFSPGADTTATAITMTDDDRDLEDVAATLRGASQCRGGPRPSGKKYDYGA